MQPTPSDLHVNSLLTNVSVAYMQDPGDFIATQVFPNVPVQKQSDYYTEYKKEFWYRTEARKRAPATETPGSGFEVTQKEYAAHVYGVHKDVDDQTRANADTQFNIDRDATLFVTGQLLLKRDLDWASTFFKTGVWGTDKVGTTDFTKWDASGSDPITDIQEARLNVRRTTGRTPNLLVIGPEVESSLLNHSLILDRIKYTQRGVVTRDLLASLFGVDRLLVANAIVNTSPEHETPNFNFLYGKRALFAFAPPNAGLMTPSAGYTFSWNGYFGAGNMGTRIKRFRMELIASDRIEGEMAYDMRVVSPELGVMFDQVIA
jgi:Phage major capsid protein E